MASGQTGKGVGHASKAFSHRRMAECVAFGTASIWGIAPKNSPGKPPSSVANPMCGGLMYGLMCGLGANVRPMCCGVRRACATAPQAGGETRAGEGARGCVPRAAEGGGLWASLAPDQGMSVVKCSLLASLWRWIVG
jgi:hypothetical protein